MLLDDLRARLTKLNASIVSLIREFEQETGVRVIGVDTRHTMKGDVFVAKVDL